MAHFDILAVKLFLLTAIQEIRKQFLIASTTNLGKLFFRTFRGLWQQPKPKIHNISMNELSHRDKREKNKKSIKCGKFGNLLGKNGKYGVGSQNATTTP
jgi:hypothetical protein